MCAIAVRKPSLLAFGLLILLVAVGFPIRPCSSADEPKEPNAGGPGAIADQLAVILQELEVLQREIRRDTFDPRAIVQRVGTDPEKLFEWVRDNTYWVPYRGSLRGPTGVLMDRLGNSLDRTLLLAELLESCGYEVRLARAQLPEDQARKLSSKVRPVADEPVPATGSAYSLGVDAIAEGIARDHKVDASEVRRTVAQELFGYERTAEAVVLSAAEQTPILVEAVSECRKDARGEDSRLAALRDHWWVQVETEGDWMDLDPLLPEAEPGTALVSPDETLCPDELAEDVFHVVIIRIVVEQWHDGRLDEHVVLEQALHASELPGEPIVLTHHPMDWPSDLDVLEDQANWSARLRDVMLAQKEWMPVLLVGSRPLSQSSFADTGEINENPETEPAGELGESVGGGFGGLFGGGASKERAAKDSFLTAEWIEYELRSPSQPTKTMRRELFDLIGNAARKAAKHAALEHAIPSKTAAPNVTDEVRLERAFALAGEVQILALACQPSSAFLKHLVVKRTLVSEGALLDLLRGTDLTDSREVSDGIAELAPPISELYSLALVRKAWSPYRSDLYFDRPNILTYHSRFRVNAKGELVEWSAFDIVENYLAVRPRAGSDSFRVRLEQGVVDANAETAMLGPYGHIESASQLFAHALASDVQWVCLRTPGESAVRCPALPEDLRARIEQDLDDGYVVFAPTRAVPYAGRETASWWRVDPQTGCTLAFGDRGWGQAYSESAVVVHTMIQVHWIVKYYAQMGRCLGLGITIPLAGGGEDAKMQFVKCVWMWVCTSAFKALTKLADLEVNWTNIIVKKTVSGLWKGLCKDLWDEIESGGG